MSPTAHDVLETELHELFDRQVAAMPVSAREWDDAPMVVTTLATRRRTHPAIAAMTATAVAAAIAVVVGIAAIAPGGSGVHVAGRPGAPAPLHFATNRVSLDAGAMDIEAGGRHFTAGGSTVAVRSDPGTPDQYTTLELIWTEQGVEMRLFVYFASDGHDWWASGIRTYNGNASGEWIDYPGTRFRTPLGRAYAAPNVDLAAAGGRITFTNLRLQAFLPPAVCAHPTTKYALDPAYTSVAIPKGASGFGLGTTRLLDTASCTAVANPQAFAFDWRIDDPAVARFTDDANRSPFAVLHGADPTHLVDLTPIGPGATTLHVTARLRSTGAPVATIAIPVSVG